MNTTLAHDGSDFDSGEGGRTLAEYVGVLKRRRGIGALAFALMLALAAAVALWLPAVYRSTATILIKEQEIPQEFVRSTVTSFADERIQVISQQVMTRATLLELVDRHGLYGNLRQRETSEEIVDRMRRDIKLTPISAEVTDRRSGSQVRSTIAFSLSYDSENPASAQKIANELTTLFLNENVKLRQRKAAETTTFLDEELTRVGQHISEVEQRLSVFKRRYQGRTPDLSVANQVGAERIAGDLQRIDRDITFLEDRRAQLEAQLVETRPHASVTGSASLEPEDRLRVLRMQLASLAGQYSEDHPDVRRVRREIATLKAEAGSGTETTDREERLEQLRGQLSDARRKYSDDHPDVARLRRTEAALIASGKASATNGSDGAAERDRTRRADNPAFVTLKTQIATTQSQIDALRSERAELTLRQSQLDARVAQSPEIEREFLELVRDLDSSRSRFREMRDKQMQAQVAEQLERERKAERFTIIEPPIFPERPYRPNRQLILFMGVLLALVGSVATMAMREAIDSTVHGPKGVVRALQVPVLAVWPLIADPASMARRRLGLWIGLGVACLLGVSLAAAVHWLVMPLDVAWFSLLRRLSA